MKFKVGDKVVCVDNSGWEDWLIIDKEYNITQIHKNGCLYVTTENGNDFGFYPEKFEMVEYGPEHIVTPAKSDPNQTYLTAIEKDVLETQVGGDHYKNFEIQPIEFIMKNKIGFAEGNIIKYICRHPFKNGAEDLKKIKHYIDIILKYVYGE